MLVPPLLAALAVLAEAATAQDTHTSTDDVGGSSPTSSGSRAASSTTSTSAGPATVTIAVGAHGHFFSPAEAEANVGDYIKFNFYPGAHRVARAEFGWPCIPYEYANINKPGFYTGVFEPQVVSNDPPSYQVRVNDTEPIFFYCAAPGSCVDYHMIGVINPNSTQTLDAQLAFARNTTYQLAPGEPFPSETPVPRPQPGSGSGSGQSGEGGGDDDDDDGGGLSAGAIAGIAIGGAAVLILGGALVYLCGRRGGFDKAYRKSFGAGAGPGAGAGMVEARYANNHNHDTNNAEIGSGPGVGLGVVGQGHDKNFPGMSPSVAAGYYGVGGPGTPHSASLSVPLSPGGTGSTGLPAYYGQGSDVNYGSPHSSPRTDHFTRTASPPPPVELPTHSPPGYQSREPKADGGDSQGGKP